MSKKNRRERELAKKAMEESMDSEALEGMEKEMSADLIDFDGWWAARSAKIPGHHYKEIIKADFRGRGLSTMETMEDFDEALKEYGIKLS